MPETNRFYYFSPTKYALEAVKNHRLKIAELDKTNDPYELLPIRWDNADDDKSFQDTVKNEAATQLKMVCLSKTYNNPSLWGHYADKCRGICLGFDIDTDGHMKKFIYKVKYKKNRIGQENFGLQYVNGELMRAKGMSEEHLAVNEILRYKSHHWKHEKEWRIWITENDSKLDPITGLYFYPFANELKLREILIGFRCEEENIKRRFERLINNDDEYPDPKPAILCTRLSPTTYEIEKTT